MDNKAAILGTCTIPPKTLHYFSNGTGRDTYIGTNCGGFFAERKPMLPPPVGKKYRWNVRNFSWNKGFQREMHSN